MFDDFTESAKAQALALNPSTDDETRTPPPTRPPRPGRRADR